MIKQIKIPKGIIKIIAVKMTAGLMFVSGLIMTAFFQFFSIIGEAILAGLLFIIASIGLWKLKKWGLFVAYFALGIAISIATTHVIILLILKEVPGVIGANYLLEILWYVPPIFIAISILYFLWRNRKCFS